MTETTTQRPTPQIEDVLALSPLQQGLFSLAKLVADDAKAGVDVYTVQFVIDIVGAVDAGLLRRSAETMLARHANLRASFWDVDLPHPVQIIPAQARLPWREIDAAPDEFDQIARTERTTNFDLARGPLLRFVLARCAPEQHRLIITVHHLLLDGWSMAVFFDEMVAIYRAGGIDPLPAPRPYRDYIGWLAGQNTDEAVAAWRDYLAPLSTPAILADGGKVELGGSTAHTHEVALDRDDTDRLTEWARRNGLTLNTVLQFAWAVLLGRLTDRTEVAFGTVVSGRPQQLTGVETMVGLFINTVPVIASTRPGADVVATCQALQRDTATMRDLGYVSLAAVQRAAGNTLFDTLLVFENAPLGSATAGVTTPDGVRFVPVTVESLTHYPLTVVSSPPRDGRLTVLLEAIPDALGELSVPDLGQRLLQVLRQLVDPARPRITDLDVLLPAERARHTEPETSANTSVPELFAAAVAAHRDAPALTGEDRCLTYAELAAEVDRLARALAGRGVGPEDRVAIALPRSPDSVIAILAVLQAGAAYVPIDISLPTVRIESILRQADPILILTQELLAELRSDTAELRPTPAVIHPDSAAYVIFTSGSTGEPKGVVGTHRALASYFADHEQRMYAPAVARLGRKLRVAHAWSLSFDASWQPLVGLLGGQTVHLFSTEEMRDAEAIIDGIRRHRLDMIDTSPSMFTQLFDAGLLDAESQHRLTVLALGGEAITPHTWARLRAAPATAVHNCYGPTETTVEAVVAAVADTDVPVIGEAVRGMTAYVLDSGLREVPDGVAGELYLSGAQVTRGYQGRAGATASRYVADPFRAGARMYRTGDLVRRRVDGRLVYLGRADDQVKVRGYRVEIAEVEAALSASPGVVAAAVLPLGSGTGTRLIGFVTGPAGGDLPQLRAHVGTRLPVYMMPARLVAVDAMPLTVNGKLDTEALLTQAGDVADHDAGRAPETDTERVLAAALAELFDGVAPGVTHDLFELGLDSIVAISLVNKLRGLAVTPRLVLNNPTIELLAAAIDLAQTAPGLPATSDADRYGEVAPAPIVSWLYEHGGFRRLAQNMLITVPSGIEAAQLEAILQAVLDRHDMLRARLDTVDGEYRLVTRPPGAVAATDILTRVSGPASDALARHAREMVDGIDPFAGAMVRALWCDDAPHGQLLLVVHHLATDVVSWYVLLAGFAAAWEQPEDHETPGLPGEYTTYRQWTHALEQHAGTAEVTGQRDYWLAQLGGADPALGARLPDPGRDTWASLRTTDALSEVHDTTVMLEKASAAGVGVREFLLTALTMTLTAWRIRRGEATDDGVLVALEGHGREDDQLPGLDSSATVGWFTNVFPVRLGSAAPMDVSAAGRDPAAARVLLRAVCDHLAAVPGNGLGYGLLRYTCRDPELAAAPQPQVEFNYVGRLDLTPQSAPWTLCADPELNALLPLVSEPDLPLRYTFDVIAAVQVGAAGPQLRTTWCWSEELTTEAEAADLAALWCDAVKRLGEAL
ncbi:non-ribosomal peptide synthetase [[Mycobacterium] vasticus]|uniref:Non-ribosomal peptide synthetase n=1 Tax=[Mycobacterium] vasticus TaxID=2875777 RepID=A0ABU5YSI4_9MYCO|nr:non-ribosomal peptide synthetase [Mycolicibacter sp. MYC017]MEB3067725.1 non-ribosomal peptide synthetase [Mycolicibacter sp. MYC017]